MTDGGKIAEQGALASFRSRIDLHNESESKWRDWPVIDFQYTNSYFVGLSRDNQTLYMSGFLDAQPYKHILAKPINRFFATTSIDVPDQ